jgi:hypothetical protein
MVDRCSACSQQSDRSCKHADSSQPPAADAAVRTCSWKHSRLDSEAYAENSQVFTPEAVDFQRKVLWFGGLGNETYLPPWLGNYPQTTSMEKAKLEFDLVVVKACA